VLFLFVEQLTSHWKKFLKKIHCWSLDTLLSKHLLRVWHSPAYWGKKVMQNVYVGGMPDCHRRQVIHSTQGTFITGPLSVLVCPFGNE
jgi:hypothetical protein